MSRPERAGWGTESRGPRPTTQEGAMAFFNRAGACVVSAVLLLGTSAFAAMSTLKAQEARLKAQGKLELCLKKNSAKVLAGGTDQSTACQSKFSAVLTKTGNVG